MYFTEIKRFKALIEKFEKGKTTEKENEAIETFFENMQKESVDLQDFKKDLGLKNRIYENISRRIKPKKKINRTIVAITAAATCLVLYFLTSNILNSSIFNNKDWIVLENFEQNPKQIFLPDSSTIWLSENSTLKYSRDFNKNNRTTQLYGQAFFDITKNPKKPFSIKTGKLITEVLGTSFNIRENDSLVEVSVSTGLVNISVDNKNLQLTPNQKISYKSASQKLVKTNTNGQLQQLWFKSEVVLEQVKIKDLTDVLKKLYKKPFVYKNQEAKKVKLYSFRINKNEPLSKLIKRINFLNEVRLKTKNNMVEIQ